MLNITLYPASNREGTADLTIRLIAPGPIDATWFVL